MGRRETWKPRHAWLEEAPSGCRRIGRGRRPRADRRACGRRDDSPRSDRQGRRRRPAVSRRTPPTTRLASTRLRVRVARRLSFHRPGRPPCLDGDHGRPRATARSSRCRRWDGDSGRRTRATTSRPGRRNAFFRYKSIIGESLRARSPGGQGSEAVLACNILNRMTALGRPTSYRVGQ